MKSMISITSKGSFKNTNRFFNNLLKPLHLSILDKYGKMGVDILSRATPKDSGVTSESWYYIIDYGKNDMSISWYNSNITDEKTPIVILLQYGHATNNGGYVKGNDYLNPKLAKLFDKMSDDVWKEVMSK